MLDRRAFLSSLPALAAAQPRPRPNVLVFLTDQESATPPGPVNAPNRRRLDKEGRAIHERLLYDARNVQRHAPHCSQAWSRTRPAWSRTSTNPPLVRDSRLRSQIWAASSAPPVTRPATLGNGIWGRKRRAAKLTDFPPAHAGKTKRSPSRPPPGFASRPSHGWPMFRY